jgi:tRNA U34 2-thiouridine synthase MnmA/TrmU
MEMTGADFIVTGEVLGQRPMSQRRDNFPVIDKKAGVQRLVLRPLTAKLLEPTMPELNGIVDRGKLYAFNGRSRKPQIALAKELGLTQYPSPGGGCLLTDVGTSNKLRELFQKNQRPDNRDIKLINVGRHFRISPTTKIIIGRDEADNAKLNALILPTDYLFNVDHYGSPLALINGEATEENIKLAASLCARYSSARTLPLVEVSAYQGRFDEGNLRYKLTVEPAKDSFIQKALLT